MAMGEIASCTDGRGVGRFETGTRTVSHRKYGAIAKTMANTNDITIRVRCRQTHDLIELPLRSARLAGTAREPWVAYDCPLCSSLEGVAVASPIADELRRHGMINAGADLAIELLEPHPEGTFDDAVLDNFMAELETRDDLVGLLVTETIGDPKS